MQGNCMFKVFLLKYNCILGILYMILTCTDFLKANFFLSFFLFWWGGVKAPLWRRRRLRLGGIKKCLKASWWRCYYPHRSSDSLSPVCGIFPRSHSLVQNLRRFSNILRNHVIAWLQLFRNSVHVDTRMNWPTGWFLKKVITWKIFVLYYTLIYEGSWKDPVCFFYFGTNDLFYRIR